jgi:hypothetical protein
MVLNFRRMMDEFPPNSHVSKQKPMQPKPVKKVERVVEGQVLRKQKSFGRRFAEIFIGGDVKGVGSFIFTEIMIPAAKDAIADGITQGIERMLFGEVRSTSRRRGGYRPQQGNINYTRYANRNASPPFVVMQPQERKPNAPSTYEDIVLETRGDAEAVIHKLYELVASYDAATVADLYELVGMTGSFVDNKWGWTNIQGSGVERVRNGYMLSLPDPEPLD